MFNLTKTKDILPFKGDIGNFYTDKNKLWPSYSQALPIDYLL
jgi:hypothetical protein